MKTCRWTLCICVAVALLVLLAAGPKAMADWDESDPYKMHYPQLPQVDYGWDVCLCCQWLADDFVCSETGTIDDIHLWVSFKEDDTFELMDSAMWDISIRDDAGGTPGNTILWQFTGGNIQVRYYGQGPQGWLCPSPPASIIPPYVPDHTGVWQVNFTNLLEPMTQQQGTTYWLVVKVNLLWAPPPAVGWKSSGSNSFQSPAMYDYGAGWMSITDVVDEIHDLAFVITGNPLEPDLDFGDVPDSYGTISASNGARHTIVTTGPYLGLVAPDPEPDGQPSPGADGDDLDLIYPPANDDEDGVVFPVLIAGGTVNVPVTVGGTAAGGVVEMWVDSSGDGAFQHPAEQVYTGWLAVGVNFVPVTIPAGSVVGSTYARVRISTLGGLPPTGPASDGEVEDYKVVTEEEPPPTDAYKFEFSLDIGSDIELSDPFVDGDEAADPGDVYWWQSAPIIPPGRDGFKDDFRIFGTDPNPNPPDGVIPPATRVPVGSGGIEQYSYYFDLDGHDQIDVSLHQEYELYGGILAAPIPQFTSVCIHDPQYLMVSYDDDKAPGWPVNDVPVTTPSPTGVSSYGTTAARDEIIGVTLAAVPAVPRPVLLNYPIADEVTVHQSMAPNPDNGDMDDDDVDSLDVVPDDEDQQCPYWYFTADHEANNGLDPGDIYEVANPGPGYTLVIDDVNNLGIPDSTDVDAFEFTWLTNQQVGGLVCLAVLFSVDENDPLTPQDESGGLNPRMIYYSFMTGWSAPLLDAPLKDDIDALTIWKEQMMEADLGDAPDSTNNYAAPMTAYPLAAVPANFPTVFNDNFTVGGSGTAPYGPIHLSPASVAYLGASVSTEAEADVAADSDGVNNINPPANIPDQDGLDDGVVNMPLFLPRCRLVTFDYTVSVTAAGVGRPLYVNVWFDWNRDGDWNDTLVCTATNTAPEWAVQNQLLSFAVAGQTTVTSLPFRTYHALVGPDTEPIWMRITIAEQPWTFATGGEGPQNGYAYGETEDYLFIPDTSCWSCADFDFSGLVNISDLMVLAENWIWIGPAGGFNEADLDCDGDVQLDDFSVITSQWLSSCP